MSIQCRENCYQQAIQKEFIQKPAPVIIRPPQISHEVTQDSNQTPAMKNHFSNCPQYGTACVIIPDTLHFVMKQHSTFQGH
jgi:hypothetical protein